MNKTEKIVKLEKKLTETWDEEVFNELVELIRTPLNKHISTKINDEESINDVLNKALISIFKKKSYQESKGSFLTFAKNEADYRLKDYIREKNGRADKKSEERMQKEQKEDTEQERQIKAGEKLDIQYHDDLEFAEIITINKHRIHKPTEDKAMNNLFWCFFDDSGFPYFTEADSFSFFSILVQVSLTKCGKPHQVLVFHFSKIIYPKLDPPKKGKKVIKTSTKIGKPQLVVDNLSNLSIGEIKRDLVLKYKKALQITIVKKIIRPFGNIIAKTDGKGVIIADRVLKEYYGKNPVANIENWSHRVGERTDKYMLKHYDDIIKKNYAALSKGKKVTTKNEE